MKLLIIGGITFIATSGIDARSIKGSSIYPRSSVAFTRPSSTEINAHNNHKNDRQILQQTSADTFLNIPRGGEVAATASSSNMVTSLLSGLCSYIKGAKSDTLSLLGTTALVAPICNKLGISNILGFLAAGMALGPNGIKGGLINDIHTTEMLADLGIVFFLFEMVRYYKKFVHILCYNFCTHLYFGLLISTLLKGSTHKL